MLWYPGGLGRFLRKYAFQCWSPSEELNWIRQLGSMAMILHRGCPFVLAPGLFLFSFYLQCNIILNVPCSKVSWVPKEKLSARVESDLSNYETHEVGKSLVLDEKAIYSSNNWTMDWRWTPCLLAAFVHFLGWNRYSCFLQNCLTTSYFLRIWVLQGFLLGAIWFYVRFIWLYLLGPMQVEELMEHIPGPDFPTGGQILGNDGYL